MKRILYSCLILFTFCMHHVSKAQAPQYSITANPQCYSVSGVYQATAAIVLPVPGANTYSWQVISNNCTPTFTTQNTGGPGTPANNNEIWMTIPCCGDYTVICTGWFQPGNTLIGPVIISQFQSGNQPHGVIYCPNGAGITPSTQVICANSAATITPSGAATYTWSNGNVTAANVNNGQIVVNPGQNTCYSYTGTTAQGCTVTPASAACVSVQAISTTVTPLSQIMCPLGIVGFTANALAQTSSSFAPGTNVTGYQWHAPPGPPNPPISTTNTASHATNGGTYSVVVTHTGQAGTCQDTLTSVVTLSTSIPVTITPSSFSVCPDPGVNNLTLTATSAQTAAAQYTWYRDFNSNGNSNIFVSTGNPFYARIPANQFARTYDVTVQYGGCSGHNTITIGMLTITPTLFSSAPTTCPGQSLTLTAGAGLTYTFTQWPGPGPGYPASFVIPKGTAATNTVVHTPVGSVLPIQYCVYSASAGCTGTTCIIVDTRTLFPTLTASTPSVCPATQFTLTTSGSGVHAGANYTFSAGYAPGTIGSGASNTLAHLPTGTGTNLSQSYTVTIDSAGCSGKATVTVYKLDLKPILSSGSPSICAGTQLTLNVTGGAGAGTQYTYTSSHPAFDNSPTSTLIANSNSTTPHTPPNTATLVTYTVSVDSAGCKGSGTYSVGILNLGPKLTLTTNPLGGFMCPGTDVTIKALGALNYTFYAPSAGSYSVENKLLPTDTAYGMIKTPTLFLPSGVVYTVQADSSTCIGTKTIAVHEYTLHPQLLLSPKLVCKGMPVAITVTNVGIGVNPTTYTYISSVVPPTGPPSTLQAGVSSFSISDNPTTTTAYLIVADSMGCKGITNIDTAYIRPDLVIIPSASAASVCPGMSATLSVLAPTTALSYTYTWSQISGTSQVAPPPPPGTSTLLTYPFTNSTYSINVLDSMGCVGNTIVSVGIDPAISFSINLSSSGSTICAPATVTLTASTTVTPFSFGTINYTWTPNIGLSPSNTTAQVVAGPTVTTLYTVIADNGFGCVSQNTIDVPVGTIPTNTGAINATAVKVCAGYTSTLTAFGANSYTWTGTPGTGSFSPIAQQSIAVGPGSYTVLLSNGGSCTSTAVQNVSIMPNFTPQIVVTPGTKTTCIVNNTPKFSKPVHLVASGAGTYVWFPYNPLHMTYSLGAQTDVRPPTTTEYTVVGSTAICSGTNTVKVVVIPQFTMNVVPPLPALCIGDSLDLNMVNIQPWNGTAGAVGPTSAFTYSWSEALNAPPISMTSYFSPSVTVYPKNTTTYTAEVRDSRECISLPRLVTVTVLPQPITAIAIPTINGVTTNTVCYVGLNPGAIDVTINLIGNNMNTALQFGVVPTYTWISPYAPKYNSILTPVNNNAITVAAPVRVLNDSPVATYTLISGYNGVKGCKRLDTVSVRVIDCRPVRAVKFTTTEPNDTICAMTCITYLNLTDTMAGGPQEYKWTFSGGSPRESTEQSPTVCYNFPDPKGYDVVLQVSNPYPKITPTGIAPGSTYASGVRKFVTVVDIPNVTIVSPGQLRSDTTIRFGQDVNLNGSGAHSYEWSPAYNISSLTNPSVKISPFKTTQYILTGYNSKSCFSSDTLNVFVIDDCGEMYVPNAFTPNGDGHNDVLYVRGICLQSLTFMIFDRWGEKVFETADQSVGWDGSYKGQDLNAAVFVYRLEGKTYDGKGFSSKGNITLIR